jgi:hypothetical protein
VLKIFSTKLYFLRGIGEEYRWEEISFAENKETEFSSEEYDLETIRTRRFYRQSGNKAIDCPADLTISK